MPSFSDGNRRKTYAHLFAAGLLLPAVAAPATVAFAQKQATSTVISQSNDSYNITTGFGVSAFYDAGYTGTRAVVANIEAGFVYHYHPNLSNDTIQLAYGGTYPAALGRDPSDPTRNAIHDDNLTNDPLWTQYDYHATATGGLIASTPDYTGDTRAGIAYGATLVSGSIATDWISNSGSFDITNKSFYTPYIEALQTGISELGNRRANVVNGSYGFTDNSYADGGKASSGSDAYTVAFDGLARSSGALMVWSSGNNQIGTNRVNDPAAGYNGMSVGATYYGDASNPFTQVDTTYSSGGPTDFLAPDGRLISNIRATVDIVAPGTSITTPAYTGVTGEFLGGTPPEPSYRPGGYFAYLTGTSFSAPIVAGAASLLTDVGYDRFGGGNAVNGTVLKAVLMNAAHPTAVWDNGQHSVGGVITTTQALDYSSGAGYLDAGKAFTQYTAGTTNVSNGQVMLAPAAVASVGWDYGYLLPTSLVTNPANDYLIAPTLAGGSTFDATLTWFVDRTFDGLNGPPDPSDPTQEPGVQSSDLRFTNLNLELWKMENGLPAQMIALSDAAYISTQHFLFTLPSDGQYMLRVSWAGDQYNVNNSDGEGQYYGLAWSGTTLGGASAPDASTLSLFLLGISGIAICGRQRQRSPREPIAG